MAAGTGPDLASHPYRMQTDYERTCVEECMQEFRQMTLWRNTLASQLEEVAALIAPNFVNTFYYGSYNWPGMKKTQMQIDATGMMSLHRFGAICDSLLTPRNSFWHTLTAEDPELRKDRSSRLWFEQTTRDMFDLRYAPIGNFSSQNQMNFQQLGAFGTMGMFIDQAVDEQGNMVPYIRYKALPLGELFLRENHQGLIDGFIRWFRLDARQAMIQFGPEGFPEALRTSYESKSQTKYNFLHRVVPNSRYEPGRLDHRGKRFASYYVSIEGNCLCSEGGYSSFPLACGRYEQAPGEVYGRSPAMMVLPSLKTLNAQKATFLKQGHRNADPVLLTADDGLIDVSLRPGALNKGGVTMDGKPLVHTLPVGNIAMNEKMMDMESGIIKDAFMVSLFQILTESPQMTATEVIERVNEKGILINPTMGRQQSEYLGTLVPREYDLMRQMRRLRPMPPQLARAAGRFRTEYTSPLSRAQKAADVAGLARTLETSLQIVNATQDPSVLDVFAFDRAIPDIAEIQAVPVSWMATEKEIAAKRKSRMQAAKAQQDVQALPAQAAMLKAQAVAGKASQGNAVQQQEGAARQGQPFLPQGGPPQPQGGQ
jgi:Bacteriophage head to tail connecting protein